MKKLTLTTLTLATLALTACSHQNPLTKQNVPPEHAGEYLYQAAKTAGTNIKPAVDGASLYASCMDDASTSTQCKKIYSAMLIYTKNNHKYGAINLSDIRDQAMWDTLRDYYEKAAYFDVQY